MALSHRIPQILFTGCEWCLPVIGELWWSWVSRPLSPLAWFSRYIIFNSWWRNSMAYIPFSFLPEPTSLMSTSTWKPTVSSTRPLRSCSPLSSPSDRLAFTSLPVYMVSQVILALVSACCWSCSLLLLASSLFCWMNSSRRAMVLEVVSLFSLRRTSANPLSGRHFPQPPSTPAVDPSSKELLLLYSTFCSLGQTSSGLYRRLSTARICPTSWTCFQLSLFSRLSSISKVSALRSRSSPPASVACVDLTPSDFSTPPTCQLCSNLRSHQTSSWSARCYTPVSLITCLSSSWESGNPVKDPLSSTPHLELLTTCLPHWTSRKLFLTRSTPRYILASWLLPVLFSRRPGSKFQDLPPVMLPSSSRTKDSLWPDTVSRACIRSWRGLSLLLPPLVELALVFYLLLAIYLELWEAELVSCWPWRKFTIQPQSFY